MSDPEGGRFAKRGFDNKLGLWFSRLRKRWMGWADTCRGTEFRRLNVFDFLAARKKRISALLEKAGAALS